jgi:anti-sigma factor RsiW
MTDPSNSNSRERREAKPCEPFAERMYLLAAVELEQTEAIEAETHAAQCQECGTFLLQNQQMMEMLAGAPRPEPSADLLAACRAGLTDALDEAEAAKSHSGWRGWLEAFMPTQWLALHPAAAAVVLIFLGFTRGGWAARLSPRLRLLQHPPQASNRSIPRPARLPSTINIYAPQTLPELIGSLRRTMPLPKYKCT